MTAIAPMRAPVDDDAACALPRSAPATVRRPRLVSRLRDAVDARVALLVAPAGYGKTTVLTEWASRDERPFAWVSLDMRDNEPMRLLSRITRAVDAVHLDGSGSYVLVLDDVHVLRSQPAVDVLNAVAADLPPQAMLALASRTEPPLPVARLRAQRLLVELRAEQLALTPAEVAAVVRRDHTELDPEALVSLVHLSEGWPAGVSLALLAAVEGSGSAADDPLVTDFVRDEVLSGLPADQLDFLRRTCLLEVLTGPACDFVTGRHDSVAMLTELTRADLMLIGLDRRGDRFRHHRLLARALQRDLHCVDPVLELELHRRTSAWHRRAGELDGAVRHALAAADVRTAAAIVWRHAATEIAHGRMATVDRWLERFTPRQMAAHAPLALAAATRDLAAGRGDLVEHWLAVATAAAGPAPAAPVAAAIAALRAAAGHHGLAAARAEAERAAGLLPDHGPCQALCCFTTGVAAHLMGDRLTASDALAEGVRRAAVTAPSLHALCLAQLAVLALERDDWEDAAGLVTRARAQVDRFRLAGEAGSALVFAVSALVRAHRGRVQDAQGDLREATRLAAALTDYAPWYELELALLIARTELRLCDAADAGASVDAAARRMRTAPEATVLAGWLDEAQASLAAFAGPGGIPPASLTTAELRILGFLPTHLSFREIAEQTYVSANTVKTQANAVYRKLDVSCRSEAVARAHDLGLIDTGR
jgi:LuxR family maltose regulon positive regulatory protein